MERRMSLEHHLHKLDVSIDTLSLGNSYPLFNPADIIRLAITKELHQITGVDVLIIYSSLKRLQTTQAASNPR